MSDVERQQVSMNVTSVPAPRITAIYRSGLFDRAGSEQFDPLTEHVRVMLGVPVAIISIVDVDRQVFAGYCGLPERVVGATLSAFAPETMGDMHSAYAAVLKDGQPRLHANHTKAIGGRWYENRIRRIGSDRIASVFADVTDRKIAEGFLKDSGAYWRGLFEQLEEGSSSAR